MKKVTIVFLALLIVAGLVAGCGQSSTTTVVGRSGVLRIAIPSDPPTLDPARITDTTSSEIGRQIFEGLVTYDRDLNIIPSLAEKWDISPEGTTYTFHLRDAKFSNGDPCTANDVKWSFERVLLPETKSERTWIFDEIAGSSDFMKGKVPEVTGIKVVDEKTLEIKIMAPSPIFLHKMTYSSAFVVDQKVVNSYTNNESAKPGEKNEGTTKPEEKKETTEIVATDVKEGMWFEKEAVGTGPFTLLEWKRGQKVVLVPNDNYWGEKAMVERLEFPIFQEDTVRMQEYQVGNVDVLYPIPDADFEKVKADPKLSLEILQVKELSIYYIGFMVKTPPFDNVKVRKAFNMAINRQEIIDKLFHGRNLLATGIIPPSMANYKSLTDAYPYDPVKAKQLIEEAKKEGVKIPDKIKFAFNLGNVTHKNVAEYIQSQIKGNLGINLELESEEWAAYLKDLDAGKFPMFRLGWVADYPDPDNFLWVLLDSANAGPNGGASFYSNPNFDKLVRDAKVERDTKKRMDMYAQAEKIAMDDAPWVPIAFQASWTLVKPYVKGYVRTAMGPLTHNLVRIEPH